MLVIRALSSRMMGVSACILTVRGVYFVKNHVEVLVDIARWLVNGYGVERCNRAVVMLITRFN